MNTTRRHFQRGGGGVYTCNVCKRSTRLTTNDCRDSHLCEQCWDLAGLDNTINDNGLDINAAENADYKSERDALLAVITERGGNADLVKAANDFLWPVTAE